jgi:HD superfamily phosphodiesterase
MEINTVFEDLVNFLANHYEIDDAFVKKMHNVFDLTVELTNDYDESHDINHHVDVYKNAVIILESFGDANQMCITDGEHDNLCDLLMYSSLLHDTIDHKYKNHLEEKIILVNNFLKNVAGEKWIDIKWIIDNISYTKEQKNGYPYHPNKIVSLARDIVSDSDKLEALGQKGLKRCYQYTIASNGGISIEKATPLVIEHCHEKLLKLKDNYIRTAKGKEMANPLHMILVDFVGKL